jgi:hypothetical protein
VHEGFTRHYQDLVARFTRDLVPVLSAAQVRSAQLRPIALRVWQSMITDPPPVLMEAYFALQHDETFGLGRHVSKARKLDKLWPLKLLLKPSYRKEFRQHLTEIGWTPGYAKFHNDRLLLAAERIRRSISGRKRRASGDADTLD